MTVATTGPSLAPVPIPPASSAPLGAAAGLRREFDDRIDRLARDLAARADTACAAGSVDPAAGVSSMVVPVPPPLAPPPGPRDAAEAACLATRDLAEVATAVATMGRQWSPPEPAHAGARMAMECEVVGGPWAGVRFLQQAGAGLDAALLVTLPARAWQMFERRRGELVAGLPAWLRRQVSFRRIDDAAAGEGPCA